jgi:predicted hydrolase (HD superfamily)
VAPEDETIGEFLDHLGKMLKVREGVDADLAEIVVQHILTPTPAEDCVEQAMTAIDSLAAARTSSPKEGADG